MPIAPFVIESFGGLNTADDPEEVGPSAATAVCDVDFDRRGRVRTRSGFTAIETLTATNIGGFATIETTGSDRHAVAGYTAAGVPTYKAYNSVGGAALWTAAAPGSDVINAVRFGAPGTQALYIANGVDTVWRYIPSVGFTKPAGMPTAKFLAVSSSSNRLIAGNTGAGGSTLEWSDAGAPETFSGNTLQLTPGDESDLMGLATWQQYVFAFKRRRFFVFGQEGVGVTGAPTFPYRAVDGYGTITPPVAGEEGVYFFDGRTVWLTTGEAPRRISRNVEALFRGEASLVGFTPSTLDGPGLASARLSYASGRLYMSVLLSGGGSRVVLVYDPKIDAWTVYSQDFTFFAPLRQSGTEHEYVYGFGRVGSQAGVYYLDPTSEVDGVTSTPISWFYNTGDYAVGPDERVAVTGYTSVIGAYTGAGSTSVFVTIATDSMSSTGGTAFTAANLLGDQEVWMMMDCEGRRWQLRLNGSSSAYISRVTHEVTFVKPAGMS